MRSPLSRVKGHGSANAGTDHFWLQRLTSLALLPLLIWFCFSIARLPSFDHSNIIAWLANPFAALMMMLFIVAGFWHGKLGLQVVIEDYVSDHSARMTLLILNTLLSAVLAALGVYAVLKLSILGGVL